MYNITFPSDTKDVIDGIRKAIGRKVVFLIPTKTPCTACTLDPITNTSTNPFCTTCSGEGYITTNSRVEILAHVTNGRVDNLQWVSGGTFQDGDAVVQIEYTESNLGIVNSAHRVISDGITYRIENKALRGVPVINRIILKLMEDKE